MLNLLQTNIYFGIFLICANNRACNRETTQAKEATSLLYPPYECTYGGYYGLVVVTPRPPPRPQTFHRYHDNLKNPYRIASIFDMEIDIGERIVGKQDGPGPIIYGSPRSPRIAKYANLCILWPIYEKLAVIFSLVIHMSAL